MRRVRPRNFPPPPPPFTQHRRFRRRVRRRVLLTPPNGQVLLHVCLHIRRNLSYRKMVGQNSQIYVRDQVGKKFSIAKVVGFNMFGYP